jgi:hypothetical protein
LAFVEAVDEAEEGIAREKNPPVASVWELLAVLAFTAGMVAWVAPRLLQKVSDSRISAMVDFVSDLRAGLKRYSADVGTLLPLDPAGLPVDEPGRGPDAPWSLGWILTRSIPPSAQGAWEHFQGPYFPRTKLDAPPLGTSLRLGGGTVGLGSRLAPSPPVFDLTGSGTPSLADGHVVAWLVVSDVPRKDFDALDARLDDGIGSTTEQRQKLGEVIWSPDNGGTMVIHLLHR